MRLTSDGVHDIHPFVSLFVILLFGKVTPGNITGKLPPMKQKIIKSQIANIRTLTKADKWKQFSKLS